MQLSERVSVACRKLNLVLTVLDTTSSDSGSLLLYFPDKRDLITKEGGKVFQSRDMRS